jgi:TfoX/Sxy family transcriptional regulator of competence genes
MPYDEGLAQRVREVMETAPGYAEKEMFGGICFLLHGNMASGIVGDDLIVRVGPEAYQASLRQPHARVFDLTGRPMKGWITVATEGLASDATLEQWLSQGIRHATTLPPKGIKETKADPARRRRSR